MAQKKSVVNKALEKIYRSAIYGEPFFVMTKDGEPRELTEDEKKGVVMGIEWAIHYDPSLQFGLEDEKDDKDDGEAEPENSASEESPA